MTTTLPATLPEDGKGYRQRLQLHLNFGRGEGSGTYRT